MIRQLPSGAPLPPARMAGDAGPIDRPLAEAWRRIDPGGPAAAAHARAAQVLPRQDGAQPRRRRSLAREIDGLMRPDIADASLWASPHSLDLLRHVADALLPAVAMEEDARAIAAALIEEEIAARITLAQRRQSGS